MGVWGGGGSGIVWEWGREKKTRVKILNFPPSLFHLGNELPYETHNCSWINVTPSRFHSSPLLPYLSLYLFLTLQSSHYVIPCTILFRILLLLYNIFSSSLSSYFFCLFSFSLTHIQNVPTSVTASSFPLSLTHCLSLYSLSLYLISLSLCPIFHVIFLYWKDNREKDAELHITVPFHSM